MQLLVRDCLFVYLFGLKKVPSMRRTAMTIGPVSWSAKSIVQYSSRRHVACSTCVHTGAGPDFLSRDSGRAAARRLLRWCCRRRGGRPFSTATAAPQGDEPTASSRRCCRCGGSWTGAGRGKRVAALGL